MRVLLSCFLFLIGPTLWADPCHGDRTPPEFMDCADITLPCNTNIFDQPYSDFVSIVEDSDCGLDTVLIADFSFERGGCSDPFVKRYTVVWQAIDVAGNSSNCTQVITLARPDFSSVEFPSDTLVQCPAMGFEMSEVYGSPTIDRIPVTDVCGIRVKSRLIDTLVSTTFGMCDVIIEKEWTLIESCTGDIRRDTQLITVIDTIAPVMACSSIEPVYTLEADSVLCCATFQFPFIDAIDLCTAKSDLLYRYRIDGQWVGSEVTLKLGSYLAEVLISDRCNNTDTCYFTVEVIDNSAPIIQCTENFVLDLSSSEMSVPVSDLGFTSFDCSMNMDLRYRRLDNGDDFQTTHIFNCDDVGQIISIELQSEDLMNGLIELDTCQIMVSDPTGICSSPLPGGRNTTTTIKSHDFTVNAHYQSGQISIFSQEKFQSIELWTMTGRLIYQRDWDQGSINPTVNLDQTWSIGSGILILRSKSVTGRLKNTKLMVVK